MVRLCIEQNWKRKSSWNNHLWTEQNFVLLIWDLTTNLSNLRKKNTWRLKGQRQTTWC